MPAKGPAEGLMVAEAAIEGDGEDRIAVELKAPRGPLEAQAPDIGSRSLAEGGAEPAMEGVGGQVRDAGQGFGRERAVEVGVGEQSGVGEALAFDRSHAVARLIPSAVPPSFSTAPARA